MSTARVITRQAAIAENWYRGRLSWKLHSAQKVINETYNQAPGKLFVANCSRQFGKTYWAVTKAVEVALQKPKAQIRYGAAFQSDLLDFIIPAFEKVMEDGPDSIKGKYKVQGSAFVFPNGSRIKLVGLDKSPNGLRGNTLDLIIIDECGFVANLDYIYKSVIIPATTHRPKARIILISTPPSTPAHSFIDYCNRAELEGCYAVFDVYQNPMLTEDTIQSLMAECGGEESTTWRREYLCEFVTDADLAIIPEWKDAYTVEIPHDEYQFYYHKYVGMDLGVKDATAVIFGYYDFKRASLVIEEEMVMSGPEMNTSILASSIKQQEGLMWGFDRDRNKIPFRRISDNNWPLLILDLASLHDLNFIPTSKDSLEAMVNEVRIMVMNGQILVNPRCKHLLGCLKYGVWDAKKKKFAHSKVYHHFDGLAALIYLVRNLAKSSNPIPVDHGFENHKAWLGNVKDQRNSTPNARAMASALMPKTKRPGY